MDLAGSLNSINDGLTRGLDVSRVGALDDEADKGRVGVRQEDRVDGRAGGDAGRDGGQALGPLHARRGAEVRSEGGDVGGQRACGAEADEHRLGSAVRLDSGLTTEVFRGCTLDGGLRSGQRGPERLLDELLEDGGVDAGSEDGDVRGREDGLGV